MSIKVISKPQVPFVTHCTGCGCKFSYELADTHSATYVLCPVCGKAIAHFAHFDFSPDNWGL